MTNAVDDIIARMQKEDARKKAALENGRTPIIELMHKHQINIIKVYFSGSGDCGCIESITSVPTLDTDVWSGDSFKEKAPELYQLIEDYSDSYSMSCDVDWYNNEGGQGTLVFDIESIPHRFEAVVEYNVISPQVGHVTEEVL